MSEEAIDNEPVQVTIPQTHSWILRDAATIGLASLKDKRKALKAIHDEIDGPDKRAIAIQPHSPPPLIGVIDGVPVSKSALWRLIIHYDDEIREITHALESNFGALRMKQW